MTDELTPNQQRALYAEEILQGSEHHSSTSDGMKDLLSDLMHLSNMRGYDFTSLLRVATDNFNAEVMDAELEGRAA